MSIVRTAKALPAAILLIAAMSVASCAQAAGWTYTIIYTSGALDFPAINDRGEVAFDATYSCPAGACDGVFRWRPDGTLTLLASGAESTFPDKVFSSVTINNQGEVGFEELTHHEDGTAADTIMVADGKKLTAIAPVKHIPNDNPPFYYHSPGLLDDGSAVFSANTLGALSGALQRADAGTLEIINKNLSSCSPPYTSVNGIVAFFSPGTPVGAPSCEGGMGIYRVDALTKKTEVALSPDAPYGNLVETSAVNDAGTVAFSADNLPGHGDDHVNGLFTVARDGTVTPLSIINNKKCPGYDQNCTWYGFNDYLSINASGAVAATVLFFPPADGFGVALDGDIQNGRVAWPGDTIEGCGTINYAIAGPHAINAAGQVALLLDCAAGYEAIALATPSD
jgi:hypothetical protein